MFEKKNLILKLLSEVFSKEENDAPDFQIDSKLTRLVDKIEKQTIKSTDFLFNGELRFEKIFLDSRVSDEIVWFWAKNNQLHLKSSALVYAKELIEQRADYLDLIKEKTSQHRFFFSQLENATLQLSNPYRKIVNGAVAVERMEESMVFFEKKYPLIVKNLRDKYFSVFEQKDHFDFEPLEEHLHVFPIFLESLLFFPGSMILSLKDLVGEQFSRLTRRKSE